MPAVKVIIVVVVQPKSAHVRLREMVARLLELHVVVQFKIDVNVRLLMQLSIVHRVLAVVRAHVTGEFVLVQLGIVEIVVIGSMTPTLQPEYLPLLLLQLTTLAAIYEAQVSLPIRPTEVKVLLYIVILDLELTVSDQTLPLFPHMFLLDGWAHLPLQSLQLQHPTRLSRPVKFAVYLPAQVAPVHLVIVLVEVLL